MTDHRKDFADGDISSGEAVVIFGAGEIAQLTHFALVSIGVAVSYYCNPNVSRQNARLRGVRVLHPDDLRTLNTEEICVFDCGDYRTYARQSATTFLSPFKKIFVSAGLLTRTDFSMSTVQILPAERRRRIALYASECNYASDGPLSLRLKTLDVVVTEACSMRCADCSNLMQYYTRPRNADLDELENSLSRLMASVDRVDEFRVLGGEPFVNRHVWRVIDRLVSYDEVDRVVVYTNGTIIPRGPNLTCLKDSKVMVDITNYGALSKRHDALVEVLAEERICYVTKRPTWTDSGRIGYVGRTPEELDRVFSHCCVNDVVTLLNGRLYLCPFSANAMNLSAVPYAPEDVIDLRTERPPLELRRLISSLYTRSKPLSSCSFCLGRDYSTPVIEPAVQTRRPLPLSVIR